MRVPRGLDKEHIYGIFLEQVYNFDLRLQVVRDDVANVGYDLVHHRFAYNCQ